jgi:hypothetical protein
VRTYSNVESVSRCFSESFEALSVGIQKAFWDFGGVPGRHRSDSLAAAVRNHTSRRELTARYAALMSYYNCEAERTNARCANENGDVESSNGHLKDRIDQALMLRGSRNFETREAYVTFVEDLIKRANDNRRKKFLDDLAHLIQTMPRIVGKNQAAINYRQIIDSLVRKPGAFASYQYREEMFPTSGFRMA